MALRGSPEGRALWRGFLRGRAPLNDHEEAVGEDDQGHEEDGVHAVQHAAVAGEKVGEVLDAAVALHQGGEEVAHLSGNAAQQAKEHISGQGGQKQSRT